MKKMMIVLMCAITSSLFAGDIYDLKFTAKTPVIKKSTQYYKDFGTKVYKGFVEIVYDEDGSIINPCNGIIYGDFSDGKIYKDVSLEINICNILGKKSEKVETLIILDSDEMVINFCGLGNCTLTKNAPCGPCGEIIDCTLESKIQSLNGNFTGNIYDVLCDPCGDKSWSWIYNVCLSQELEEGIVDVIYGNWSMKYNKKLTKSYGENFESILNKVPNQYK